MPTSFSVGSFLDLLRLGVESNWFGLSCPVHCGAPSVVALVLSFSSGLGLGLFLGASCFLILLIRVEVLEKKVIELEKGHHDDFELVSAAPRAPSPARTSSSSSSYNALALEIPELPSEALRLCGFVVTCVVASYPFSNELFVLGRPAIGQDLCWRDELESRGRHHLVTSPIRPTLWFEQRASLSQSVWRRRLTIAALLGDFSGASSLSHGFASKAEAKVYCLGVGIPYPEKQYQWS